MYQRNRLYVSVKEQEIIKNTQILIAGAGLGSNIAECALRTGFENITICDMDDVELSNLNRQNYTRNDIQNSKVESLYKRLKSINPSANIKYHNIFLTENNCGEVLEGIDIAINTIDFASKAPFIFDEICLQKSIPVLHPYNLGWAGCVFVINEHSESLETIVKNYEEPEVDIVEHIIVNNNENSDLAWLKGVLRDYQEEGGTDSPPQLAVGSWINAGICASLLFKLATRKMIKIFPDFYFSGS